MFFISKRYIKKCLIYTIFQFIQNYFTILFKKNIQFIKNIHKQEFKVNLLFVRLKMYEKVENLKNYFL